MACPSWNQSIGASIAMLHGSSVRIPDRDVKLHAAYLSELAESLCSDLTIRVRIGDHARRERCAVSLCSYSASRLSASSKSSAAAPVFIRWDEWGRATKMPANSPGETNP